MPAVDRLELRLLGGFEVRLGERSLASFESQKARALLVYLVLNSASAVDRERLAGLLWAGRSDESARRNLRQALYSIRAVAAKQLGKTTPLLDGDQRSIRLNPEIEIWTDVEAFQNAFEAGLAGSGPDVHHLATAAGLYRGDFLAGFFVRDSPEFEDWLITKQEELREEAVETFRTLVSLYLARGEYRYGIRYAKRLLSIDPLSEEAHRHLMRLYLTAGRRNRALAQYEHLLNLLQQELGVAPMEETTELYRSILLADQVEDEARDSSEPPAPMIPLVGRSDAFSQLQIEWEAAAAGAGRVTRIIGEAGTGKSRLAKSFVDGATSRRHAVVLRGDCYGSSATVCFQPFGKLIGSALTDILPDEQLGDDLLDPEALSCLRTVAGKAGQIPDDHELERATGPTSPKRVASALIDLFDLLCHPRGRPSRPLILLLEDFQWADGPSRRLLVEIATQIEKRTVWILLTSRSDPGAEATALNTGAVLHLGRLSVDDIHEIASSLVDLSAAKSLGLFLLEYSDGLPLTVAELVNLLWDEGHLKPEAPGQWGLDLSTDHGIDGTFSLRQLVQRRVATLPTSARRLLSVAAVYGHQFDVEILQKAADEHLGIVETCIELALERWLIRQFPRAWSPAGLERDIVLWARGARRGYFEFSHDEVRQAILDQINPIRRAVMHRDLALALEEHLEDRAMGHCEDLAFHWLAAQEPERALPWLEGAAQAAVECGASDIRDDYVGQALRILDRLEPTPDGAQVLEEQRSRLLELQAQNLAAG